MTSTETFFLLPFWTYELESLHPSFPSARAPNDPQPSRAIGTAPTALYSAVCKLKAPALRADDPYANEERAAPRLSLLWGFRWR